MTQAQLPDILRQLPILGSSRAALLEQHQASVRTIGQIVNTDPLLAWQLLRFLQVQFRAHDRPPQRMPTLNQALMMTGLDTFIDAMRRHPFVRSDPSTLILRCEIMKSAHAARFADYFGDQRHDLEPEELMTTALLWRLPSLVNLIHGGPILDTETCVRQLHTWAMQDEAFPELLAEHAPESERWQLVEIANQLADTLDEHGWNTPTQHALEERTATILELNIESLHRTLVNRSIALAKISRARYQVRPLLATILWTESPPPISSTTL